MALYTYYPLRDRLVVPDRNSGMLVVYDVRNGDKIQEFDAPGYHSPNAQSRQVANDFSRIVWAQLDRTEADLIVGRIR